MILYQYRCQTCKDITEALRSIDDRDNAPTCSCGGHTRKIISRYSVVADMQPYFDDNLQTYVKSKQHRRKVMKEQDVSEKFGKGWT